MPSGVTFKVTTMKLAIAILETEKGIEIISHGLPSVVVPAYRACIKPGKAYLCDSVTFNRSKRIEGATEPDKTAPKKAKGKE